MDRIAELRRIRVVMRDRIVAGRFAIGAPHTLEFHGYRIPDRDAVIAVTIRRDQLIGAGDKTDGGDAAHIVGVQAALAAIGGADFAQELAVLGEFQDEAVVIVAGSPPPSPLAGPAGRARGANCSALPAS